MKPSSIDSHDGSASSRWAAIASTLSFTALAATVAAPEPITPCRDANAPRPNWIVPVSPITTETVSRSTPNSAATTWARVVSRPCPCDVVPLST